MYDTNKLHRELWYADSESDLCGGQLHGRSLRRSRNDSHWVYVPSPRDIYRIGVQPGQTVWAMSQNEPVFAVRTADRTGLVSTAFYRFEQYDPTAAESFEARRFVTRTELEALVRRLEEASSEEPAADDPKALIV